MGQWILLSIVLALFAFAGIGVLVKHFTTDYPGTKLKWGKYRINLVRHPRSIYQSKHVEVLRACKRAVMSLVSAHTTMKRDGKDVEGSVAATSDYFKEYTVWVVPMDMLPQNAAAYITKVDKIPTCVVGDDYVPGILSTGEPVIHEGCHVVLNDYVGDHEDHLHETIWKAVSGDDSLQAVAQAVFKRLTLVS